MSSSSDEEHTTEHTPNHHVPQPPQAVFPACICAAVLPIVHLMEDGEVREDGVAGTVLLVKNINNSNKIRRLFLGCRTVDCSWTVDWPHVELFCAHIIIMSLYYTVLTLSPLPTTFMTNKCV